MAKESGYYELSYLVKPETSEDEVMNVESSLKEIVAGNEGTIESWDSPKKRRLYYSIQSALEAYLGAIRFNAPPEKVDAISKLLREKKEVMRHLIVQWHKIRPRAAKRPLVTYTPVREEKKADEETIDKRLEEILGK